MKENVIKVDMGNVLERMHEIRAEMKELYAVKLTTKERKDMPSSDFAIHEDGENKFPITSNPDSIRQAVTSWGRYKGKVSFETFKKNVIKIAKRKGITSGLPEEWKKELGMKD